MNRVSPELLLAICLLGPLLSKAFPGSEALATAGLEYAHIGVHGRWTNQGLKFRNWYGRKPPLNSAALLVCDLEGDGGDATRGMPGSEDQVASVSDGLR